MLKIIVSQTCFFGDILCWIQVNAIYLQHWVHPLNLFQIILWEVLRKPIIVDIKSHCFNLFFTHRPWDSQSGLLHPGWSNGNSSFPVPTRTKCGTCAFLECTMTRMLLSWNRLVRSSLERRCLHGGMWLKRRVPRAEKLRTFNWKGQLWNSWLFKMVNWWYFVPIVFSIWFLCFTPVSNFNTTWGQLRASL